MNENNKYYESNSLAYQNPQTYIAVPVNNSRQPTAYEQAALNYAIRRQEKCDDYLLKGDLERVKMEFKKEYQKTLEEFRVRREFPNFEVFEDSSQRLCIEYNDNKGSINFKKRVCDAVALVIFAIPSYYRGKNYLIYSVAWQNSMEKEGTILYFREDQLTPERLAKELAKRYFPIRVSDRYRKMIQILVLLFLLDRRVTAPEIPYTTGLIKCRDGNWRVTKCNETTMKELLKKCIK